MHLGYLYLSVNAKAVETEDEAGAKAVKRISVKFRQSRKLRDKINSNVQLVNALTGKQSSSSESQGDNNTGNGGTATNPSNPGTGDLEG